MKFRVGDKVEVIESHGKLNQGDILSVLEVDVMDSVQPYLLGNQDKQRWAPERKLKLVSQKKSKNQRITALESVVKDLEQKIIDIRNDYRYDLKQAETRIKMLEFKLEEQTKLIPPTIQSVEEIIEFEGNQYRKVDREARKGDVVIFKDGIKPVDWITIGKPYKATEGVDDCEKGEFIGDIYGEYPIYRYDDFNRTRETVDVYELIKQELTPNQQRAQIVEKAKKFVEEQKNRYGHYEIYDEKGVSRKCIADFKFNVEKRTIVVLLRGFESNKIYIRGIAKCFSLDVFNEHIGKAIALGRALGLDVSEFEQAVQPDEVVKGTEVFYRRDGYASTFTQIVESVGDVEMANQDLNVKDDKGWSCKIINDTNAQYEEVK